MPPSSSSIGNEVRAEIDRIRESARFRKAPVLRDLLQYLAEHAHNNPNEYAIGTEVLGRRPDFDPKFDASVRVHMGRLRQRLKDYYENEGRASVVRIVFPAGSYQPLLEHQAAASESSAVGDEVIPPATRLGRWPYAVGIGALALLVVSLGFDNWRLRQHPPGAEAKPPSLHPFWSRIARPEQPVHLIVPAPVFFLWQDFVARDFFVNDPADLPRSAHLRALRQTMGEPEVSQIYTVASDTLAASALSRYLGDRGIAVTVRDTPAVPLDMFGAQSAVMLVGPGSVAQVAELLRGMNFYLKSGTRAVLNRKPLPGEPPAWPEVKMAPLRTISYGILASIPGKDSESQVLLLASRHNTSMASFLTARSELDRLTALRKANGSPEHFEAVIEYEQNADRILRAKLIAFRPIRSSQR